MSRAGVFAVLWWWSLMSCSLGFTMDRSGLALSPWDTAPSLDAYRRIFGPVLKSKPQVTGVDPISRLTDAKAETTKLAGEVPEIQTREKRSTIEDAGIKPITPVVDLTSKTKATNVSASPERSTDIVTLRNFVLLLIDERARDEEKKENSSRWQDNNETFAVRGLLQSCDDKVGAADISTGSSSGTKIMMENCDCERLLRLNVRRLLSWTRDATRRTTGVVSGSNFFIPPLSAYESLNDISAEPVGSNEDVAKLKSVESKHDSNSARPMIGLSEQARSVPSSLAPTIKGEESSNHDDMWKILELYSKIRMAFFRPLLDSLSRGVSAFDDEFSPRKSSLLKRTETTLIENVLAELKSVSRDKGYALIAVASESEGAPIVDLLQRETSPKDTLLVVAEICCANKKSVTFVARGPNAEILRETRAIWELPMTIKKIIANDLSSSELSNRQRRNIPDIARTSIKTFSQEFPTWKHLIRNKNSADKLDTKKASSSEKTTTTEREIKIKNSSSETITRNSAVVFGVVTSILAMILRF